LHIKLTVETHLADGEFLQGGFGETTSNINNIYTNNKRLYTCKVWLQFTAPAPLSLFPTWFVGTNVSIVNQGTGNEGAETWLCVEAKE